MMNEIYQRGPYSLFNIYFLELLALLLFQMNFIFIVEALLMIQQGEKLMTMKFPLLVGVLMKRLVRNIGLGEIPGGNIGVKTVCSVLFEGRTIWGSKVIARKILSSHFPSYAIPRDTWTNDERNLTKPREEF
jgi:hypothetical protein